MSSTGPEPMAEVSIHHGAQHVTVTVTGEIDMSNARDIDQVIAAALTDPPAGPSTPPIDHEPPQEDRSRYLVFEPQCRHLPRQCGIAHDR